MVGGLYILLNVASEQLQAVQNPGESWKEASLRVCNVDPANWKMGLLMYFSYFILFCLLFFDKYCAKTKDKKNCAAPCAPTGVYGKHAKSIGSSGFFHVDNDAKAAQTEAK